MQADTPMPEQYSYDPQEPVADTQTFYNDAARQLVQDNLIPEAVIDNLVARGAAREQAETIVYDLQNQIRAAKRSRAEKDMLYGGLWCAGGTIATLASVGFIFWGAIIFGGIQFFRGLANYSDN
jgi:hypothetical protein